MRKCIIMLCLTIVGFAATACAAPDDRILTNDPAIIVSAWGSIYECNPAAYEPREIFPDQTVTDSEVNATLNSNLDEDGRMDGFSLVIQRAKLPQIPVIMLFNRSKHDISTVPVAATTVNVPSNYPAEPYARAVDDESKPDQPLHSMIMCLPKPALFNAYH